MTTKEWLMRAWRIDIEIDAILISNKELMSVMSPSHHRHEKQL